MKNKSSLVALIFIVVIGVAELSALDLKFTTPIRVSPESITPGTVVTFSVSFTPQGGDVTNFKIIGGVDGTRIFERTYASIPADRRRTDSFTWTAVSGNHTAWFELDPDRRVGDSDYSNNRTELAVSVGTTVTLERMPIVYEAHIAVFKPDLVITEARFTKDTSRNDKYFYRINFKNQGGGCIGAFNFKMYSVHPTSGSNLCSSCLQGRFAAAHPLCALKAGEEKTINGFTLKSHFNNSVREKCGGSWLFPKYKIYNPVYLIVDYDNKVDESNEDNNRTDTYELVWENECE